MRNNRKDNKFTVVLLQLIKVFAYPLPCVVLHHWFGFSVLKEIKWVATSRH